MIKKVNAERDARLEERRRLGVKASEDPSENAILAVETGDIEYLRRAISAGANLSRGDSLGMTALHHAAADGFRDAVRVLVSSGKCDFLQRDGLGRVPSQLAAEWSGDMAVARLLMKHQMRQAAEKGVPAVHPPIALRFREFPAEAGEIPALQREDGPGNK